MNERLSQKGWPEWHSILQPILGTPLFSPLFTLSLWVKRVSVELLCISSASIKTKIKIS
uniref:Uncharacterized protein n=1 Tax=Anguilla anguilla TaxID=7936 RepID=A0A0E9Q1C7_ANGAN